MASTGGECVTTRNFFRATARRVDEIRTFHALDYGAKQQRILALMDRP